MPEPSKFATLHNAHRVWAVASIHGEARRLDAVHEQIAERFEPGDRLVYLGNYLGHGKEICETLDQLLSFRRLLLSGRGMLACDIVFLRRSEEHTSELQSQAYLVCRLLLEKKKKKKTQRIINQ